MAVKGTEPRNGKRTEYRVREAKGNKNIMDRLVLHVMPSGKRAWHVHYDVRVGPKRVRRKPKVGDGNTSLATVRKKWKEITDAIDNGSDWVADQREIRNAEERGFLTFGDLADLYLQRHAKVTKRSWRDDQRKLNRYILPAIGATRVEKVTKRDVIAIVDAIALGNPPAPVQADRTKALISSVFNWGRDEDYVDHNPADRIRKRSEDRQRERCLTDDEIRRLWRYFEKEVGQPAKRRARAILQIALLTGQRRVQVSGTRIEELELCPDRPVWRIPHARAKNKSTHLVPLNPWVAKLFAAAIDDADSHQFVFPSDQVGKPIHPDTVTHEFGQARQETGIQNAVVHDLRHTVGTQLAALGVPKDIRARVLSHRSEFSDVTSRYDHFDYDTPKRKALAAWENELDRIITG